jgi:RHH-type proline utilization regulon transcriptional repressor/proline dehydrogenase/delta 1-pyrroline-5-carboxylate dehydrogenase
VAGSYVAPTVILINRLEDLTGETFGPILHVLSWRRTALPALLSALRATGYALTLGVHSRIDETVDQLLANPPAGNVYVNRNMIGAVVGVQPFGGHGLSGTGPKLGGPQYLRRLLLWPLPQFRVTDALDNATRHGPLPGLSGHDGPAAAMALQCWLDWLSTWCAPDWLAACRAMLAQLPARRAWELPGPTGECNSYHLVPRGSVLCRARTTRGALLQFTAVLATGNVAWFDIEPVPPSWRSELPPALAEFLRIGPVNACDVALLEGCPADLDAWCAEMAQRPGPLMGIQCMYSDDEPAQPQAWQLERLLLECVVSVNTAAAGGNAQLMSQSE